MSTPDEYRRAQAEAVRHLAREIFEIEAARVEAARAHREAEAVAVRRIYREISRIESVRAEARSAFSRSNA